MLYLESSLKVTAPVMFSHDLEICSLIQVGRDLGRSLVQAPA